MTTTLKHPPRQRPAYKARVTLGPLSTDRRFVLVGHTVKILVDYAGLQGHLGEVIGADFGDGKLLVKIEDREICFLSREVRAHIGGRQSCHYDVQLFCRVLDLQERRACSGSDKIRATLQRRIDRLKHERAAVIRGYHSIWGKGPTPAVLRRLCTAIVPYVPVESGVAQ